MDLVIQAHLHDYERSLPVLHGVPTSSNYTRPPSPVYVVNGAAGNRERNDHPPVRWRGGIRGIFEGCLSVLVSGIFGGYLSVLARGIFEGIFECVGEGGI